MQSRPDSTDNVMERFEAWLEQKPVTPRTGLDERVRTRIQAEKPMDLDAVIDDLLRPDPTLGNPFMAARVRQQVRESSRKPRPLPWFQWATPLAAAAVLGFAFFTFQHHAPSVQEQLAGNAPIDAAIQEEGINPDSELTQIFALASNLEATTDLSRLQSVDKLAFLLE